MTPDTHPVADARPDGAPASPHEGLPGARRPGELVFACLLVGFAGWALWLSWAISGATGLAKPGVFPTLASAAMLASGLFVLRDTVRAEQGPRGWAAFRMAVLPMRVLVTIGLVAVYVGIMPWLGFLAASALFLFTAIAYLWRRGPVLSAAVTVGALISVYLVFRIAFQVVLPQGVWIRALS